MRSSIAGAIAVVAVAVGELVNTGAQAGIAGEFVRANAQRYKGTEESIANTGVPFLKFLSCPGDCRGRDAEGP